MQIQVRHDKESRRFFCRVEGKECFMDYGRLDDDLLDYRSTFVPPDLRHQGIAGQIVRHALEWAREQGQRIVPSCSFVADFIQRNPEYEDLVAEGRK